MYSSSLRSNECQGSREPLSHKLIEGRSTNKILIVYEDLGVISAVLQSCSLESCSLAVLKPEAKLIEKLTSGDVAAVALFP